MTQTIIAQTVIAQAGTQTTENLGLPYIAPSQAQKHVTHNEALRLLDAIVQIGVETTDAIVPPEAPLPGERHIVGAGATAGWAGQDGRIAAWQEGAWSFVEPRTGWIAHVAATGRPVVHDGTGWAPLRTEIDPAEWRNREGLGLGTDYDATNRLAVAAAATLLTHEGAGHRVAINKAAPGDTASLVFQTDWSGRAELGTAGGDGFAIKVSADGASWKAALAVDPATAIVNVEALATDGTVRVGRFGTAALPDPAQAGEGALAYVSDASGGPTLAVSDGTAWTLLQTR